MDGLFNSFVWGEIWLWMLLSLLLGYIMSWLIHRWRRSIVKESQWNSLSTRADGAERELATVSAARDEALNERTALSGRINGLSKDLETKQVELSAATKSSDSLNAELAARNTEIKTLRAGSDENAARLAGLETDLSNAQGTIAGYKSLEGDAKKLRTDLDGSKKRAAELEAALAKAKDDAAAARGDLQAAEAKTGDAEARAMELEGQLRSSQAELTGAQADLAGSSDKIGSLEAAAAAAAVTAASLKASESKTGELESALAAARAELDDSQGRVADLDGRLASTGSDLDGANARIAELEGELGGAQSQISGFANLEGEAGGLRKELEAAQGRIGDLEGEVAMAKDLAKQLEAAKGRNADLEAQLKKAQELAAELEGAKARIAQLEGDLGRIPELENDLGGANERIAALAPLEGKVGELEGKLAELDRIPGLENDLGGANNRIGELEGQLAELDRIPGLENDLGGANNRIAELEGQLAELDRIPQLESDLGGANNRIAALEPLESKVGELETDKAAAIDAHASCGAEIGQLRVDLTERERRIEALEAAARTVPKDNSADHEATIARRDKTIEELRAALKGYQDMPDDMKRVAAFHSGSWKKGTTKLGTDGSDHADDLKVVSGIGPQMEQLLNSFDIKSWEQLAALDEKGIATVDAALEDFPGRISRDEWVPQAQAIMAAGHRVPEKPKKPKAAKKKTPSWQKGTTKLGTPGAAHKDDLKVINGIGPKMEGILNGFGIQTWEQVGALKKGEVQTVTEAIDTFPGRIERDEWVSQAKDLVKRFKDIKNRPTRKTFLNNSGDGDPFN